MKREKSGFSESFIRSLLLNLEETDFNEYMELSYHVIMQNPSAVFRRSDPIDEKLKSINTLIKHFELAESFEKCNNLQKLKSMLFLDTSYDDDDL